ncbi:hypothetical protein QCA50_007241 [Cerrena zonata]|uniref:Uncharacterized protein n=1 Tax=Cerrena zonata TaxID=2478898 RepID=A0AAW0GDL6_9APHY
MGYVSKSLLKTGQLYYLATVSINLVAMILLLSPSLSQVYQGMFTVPNVALQNAMACRVFRLLKLGVISDTPTNAPHSSSFGGANRTHLSTLQFPGTRTDISETLGGSPTDDIDLRTMASKGNSPIRITIREEAVSDAKEMSDYKGSPTGEYAV